MVPCHLSAPLKEVWTEGYDAVLWRLPLVRDSYLIRRKPGGGVLSQSESTGLALWEYTRPATPQLIAGDFVLAWPRADEAELLDLSTGAVTGVMRCPVPSETAVVDDRLLVTAYEGDGCYSVCCASISRGQVLWAQALPLGTTIRGTFCASDVAVFVGESTGAVVALSILDGRELWRHGVADLTWRDPTFGNRQGEPEGVLTTHEDIVILRVQHGHVVGLSAQDGRRVWAWRHAQARTDDGYLYDGRYYINSGLGTYHILDPLSGTELLSADLRATLPKKLQGLSPHGPMLVSETHTFIGTIEGYILAFERDTGRYVWHHRPKGGTGMGSYLMSVNGRLYYTDMSFRLYCLEEKEPTDPVLKAQRKKSSDVSNRQPRP